MMRKVRPDQGGKEGDCRIFIMVAVCLFVHTRSLSQVAHGITYKGRNIPVQTAFRIFTQQTGFGFSIDPTTLDYAHPVDLDLKNASIREAMTACAENQPWRFKLADSTVYIKLRTERSMASLAGATGYSGRKIMVRAPDTDSLPLSASNVSILDTTFVGHYGRISQGENTGNIVMVTSKDIVNQPVSDLMSALEGRVPGMVTTQINGIPGSVFYVRVRGDNSIGNGNNPLYIVDGVPFGRNNTSYSNISSGSSAESLGPVYLLSPGIIASVEVLKDADATAIYGSRGANGVILITTKRRKAQDPHWDLQAVSGVSVVTRTLKMLNTKEYVQMRLEALKNDNLRPDVRNAPELLYWDTASRYSNWPKILTGGMAHTTDVQATLSGQLYNSQYLVTGNYNYESTVFPGNLNNQRGSIHFSWSDSSSDKRLYVQVSGLVGGSCNNQFNNDLSSFQSLDPNAPGPYDPAGKLVWADSSVGFNNPFAYTRNRYRAVSRNLLFSGLFSYQLFRRLPGLNFQLSPGYNDLQAKETSRVPIASQDPASSPTASSYFANTNIRTMILETQLEFKQRLGKGLLSVLAGSTWQAERYTINTLTAAGLTSDVLLSVPAAAPVLIPSDRVASYNYQAFYGRINYNYQHRYLLNVTGRRDGSSRFGPGKQFGNFGAIGAGWLFFKEGEMRRRLPFLSFGKLRGSYGITGNDQIGDYQYLEVWSPATTIPYQGYPGFYPTTLANPKLAWETIHKLEFALELGLWHDRILFTGAWYRHRSGNQLLPYLLPLASGFSSVLKNFPAVVQNSGLELSLNWQVLVSRNVCWTMTLNGTFPKNRLLSFPDLNNSSAANNLVKGRSINVIRAYQSLGVDSATGVFKFADVNGDKKINDSDRVVAGTKDLRFYGGVNSSLRVYHWQLDVFIEKRVQTGSDYQAVIYGRNAPGMPGPGQYSNQTTDVLDRWRRPGDHARYQKFTSVGNSDAAKAIPFFTQSTAVWRNASFIRVKTIALSRTFPDIPGNWLLSGGRLFVEAQNLFTITPYSGTDPETRNPLTLPPLKTVVAGIQFNFK